MNRLSVGVGERAALLGLLAIATGLRVYKLDAPLWFDEVMTLIHYVRLPLGELIADYSSFNNHLFYSLQAKLAVAVFGEAPWALRLPAMIFGVASIWALWRLARTALGPAESLLAAALMAISYHHIWFSQNARGYTELMFWCLAALIIFIDAAGARSWRAWAAFGAVLAAAMYTHLTAAFFIGALGLVYGLMLLARWLRLPAPSGILALEDRAAQVAPFLGFAFGGALTLLLCAPAIPQMLTLLGGVEQSSQVDLMREYQNPLWTMLEGLRTLGGGGVMALIAPLAALAAAVGAADLVRRAPVIALVAILHVALTLGALIAVHMRIWPRFFFTDIAFALLFITHGVFVFAALFARIAQQIGLAAITPGRLAGAAAVTMTLASALLAARNYAFPKQDFPGAVALIKAASAPAGSVGAVGLAGEVYDPYLGTGWRHVRRAEDLAALTPSAGRRWAVVIFPTRTRRENADVMALLERDYALAQILPGTLGDGEVLVYASKSQGGGRE